MTHRTVQIDNVRITVDAHNDRSAAAQAQWYWDTFSKYPISWHSYGPQGDIAREHGIVHVEEVNVE